MKKYSTLNKPCKECPYRRDSSAGWLGDSQDADDFLSVVWEGFIAHPCHKTVQDWETENNTDEKPVCKGLLQFWRNNCKLPINEDLANLVKQLDVDDSEVFHWRHEFINHHNNKGVM